MASHPHSHRILVVGGGGREHALAWKLAASPRAAAVFVAPGNAGTALEPAIENVAIAADDVNALVAFARANAISLTVVGPEAALAAGIVDAFEAAGLACFGPNQRAAQLEASKAYSKAFLARNAIPTADYAVCTDYPAAAAAIEATTPPIVVKADGLAAGKGVEIAPDAAAAKQAARRLLVDDAGPAGGRIVVEAFLAGEEASFMALVDGRHVLALATSQDHKAAFDGDRGPNTGGMGAYSPAPVMSASARERAMREVIEPTVAGMAAEGRAFRGFLYAGLMLDADGVPRVLEYNVRLGDPEAQPILMRLETDLVELIEAALAGRLDRAEARWRSSAALGVVMASAGYPGASDTDHTIEGLDAEGEAAKVFHAGTRLDERGVVRTAGGRVACVTALGNDIAEAQASAYRRVSAITWRGAWYRRDIGHRALGRR